MEYITSTMSNLSSKVGGSHFSQFLDHFARFKSKFLQSSFKDIECISDVTQVTPSLIDHEWWIEQRGSQMAFCRWIAAAYPNSTTLFQTDRHILQLKNQVVQKRYILNASLTETSQ